jgi:protein SCO1/2
MPARWLGYALIGCIAALSFHLSSPGEEPRQRGAEPRQSDKLTNIALRTQHGTAVRFYDDLVKNQTVLINLMYTGCGDVCPANTMALSQLHGLLGGRVGKDIRMLSISIDPAGDSPERLKRYWESFGAKPGWLFLTGRPDEVERLRRELGLYDLDPEVDSDITQHSGTLVIGNDRSDRWLALPVLSDAPQLAATIRRVAHHPQAGDARRGRELYATYCVACHGERGRGDGPLSASLSPRPPRHDDASHMDTLPDDYLLRLLREGGAAVGKSPLMGPWGRTFSEAQLRDLVAHLRTLADR